MILRNLAIVEAWIELGLVYVFYWMLKPIAKWKDKRW